MVSRTDQLTAILDRWLGDSMQHTLLLLAQKSGLSPRQLQRYQSGQAEAGFEDALAILGVVGTREELLTYMEKFHASSLAFVRSLESAGTHRDLDLGDELARGRLPFWITAFALTGRADQNELFAFFGQPIMPEIERLEAQGLIEVDASGRIALKRIPGFFSSYDKRLITAMMHHFLDLAERQSTAHSRRHPYAFFGNVTDEGRVQIEQVLKDAALEISRIIHENEGEAMVAVSLMDMSFKELRR